MLRQRVITALIIVGAFVAVLLLAPFPVQALLFALVALAGAWEWSALAGCQSMLARAAYAAVVPLLSLGLWVLVTAGDIELAAAVRPWLAGTAMLWSAHAAGAQILSSRTVVLGPSVDSRIDGMADADYDLGRCGILSHADEWSLDGLLDDVNGCSG